LKAACALSTNPEIRFAALVHDLGKGLTDKDAWPSHHGHEKSGLKPVKRLCERLRIPNSFRDLALLTCEYHTHIHRAFNLKNSTILKVLKQCDAFRRPERFQNILACSKADSRGRTGFEDCLYPQFVFFDDILSATQAISAKELIKQGIQGKDIGVRMDEMRLIAIDNTRLAQTNSN